MLSGFLGCADKMILLRNLLQFRVWKAGSVFKGRLLSSHITNTSENGTLLQHDNIRQYLENLRTEFYNLRTIAGPADGQVHRMRKLSEVVRAFEERNCLIQNIDSLKDISNEKDEDMKELIKEEREVYQSMLTRIDNKLMETLLQLDDSESYGSLMFEVNAGVGGQEAMLFAKELFDMYCNYMDFKGWEYELIDVDHSDIGGLRHGTTIVYGEDAYRLLQNEAGVHRVQRVPATEKSGRMHTSTVSVATIPRPDDIDISINPKDLRIDTKRATGAGGQHVNTTDSAVRMTHIPTGISVECQTDRSQIRNRETAFKKLQLKLWQRQVEEQETSTKETRKSQVGSKFRNEKIRTYNYAQDRITDHRLKGATFHNLRSFLEGGEGLDTLVRQLIISKRKEQLAELISRPAINRSESTN